MAYRITPPPARGAAFYYAKDASGVLHVYLTDDARQALGRALRRLSFYEGDEQIATSRAMMALGKVIGPFGVETLQRIAAGELGEGVAVFHNLPFERVDWSPFPGMPARSAKDTCLSELLLVGVGGYMGEPYSVASEGQRLINELIPSREDLKRLTGNGSQVRLSHHYENAAPKHLMVGRDFSPKALLLTGVSEQTEGGPTTPVVIAARAVAKLSPEDRQLLRQPCAFLRVPERWRAAGDAAEVGPVPVVFGPEGREHVVAALYGDLTRGASEPSGEAIARLAEALEAEAIPLRITPGVLAYIGNGPILHGRSEFNPVLDDAGRARRWLQRLFLGGRVDELRGPRDPRDRVFDLASTARG